MWPATLGIQGPAAQKRGKVDWGRKESPQARPAQSKTGKQRQEQSSSELWENPRATYLTTEERRAATWED